jgi:hypothetical protein
VLSTLIIGIAPALRATGRSLNLQLKASSLSRENLRTSLLPRLLLSMQIALALVLVIGAGLISTSLVRMYRTGPGFDPHNINLVSLRMTKQPLEGEPLVRLYHSLQDHIAALPGVHAASIFAVIPFTGSMMSNSYDMPGGRTIPQLDTNWVAPHYFQTMRASPARRPRLRVERHTLRRQR